MNGQRADQKLHEGGPRGRDGDMVLFQRVREGDAAAFEQLYREYHPRLTRFLARMLRRTQVIEEVLNDTMMVVWERGDSFNGASKLSTWIFGIAYRKALNARSRQDEPVQDSQWETRVSPDPSPEEEAAQARRQALLRNALAELSVEHRTVLDLTYNHEMGYNEIASIMRCPVGTVKTRALHARRHLKRRLAGGLADWV